jgi:hypothetical protein
MQEEDARQRHGMLARRVIEACRASYLAACFSSMGKGTGAGPGSLLRVGLVQYVSGLLSPDNLVGVTSLNSRPVEPSRTAHRTRVSSWSVRVYQVFPVRGQHGGPYA